MLSSKTKVRQVMRGLGGSWGLGPDLMFSGKEKVLLGILYIVQSLRISLQSGVLGSQLLTWFTFFPSAPYWKKSTELLIISFFACQSFDNNYSTSASISS